MSMLSKLLISIFTLLFICGCSVPTERESVIINGETGDFRPPPPEIAYLDISTQGTTNTLIDSIDVTVILPPGVVVKASPDPYNPSVLIADEHSVVPSGHAYVNALYTAATASAPGKLMLHATVGRGYSLSGKFASVKCDLVKGGFKLPLDFGVLDFKAMDLTGAAITGLSAGFEVEIS